MTADEFDAGFSSSICPAFVRLIRYEFNEVLIRYSGRESTPQFDVLSTFVNERSNVAVDVNWDVRSTAISVGVYRAENGIIPRNRSFYGESGKVPMIELLAFLRLKYGENRASLPIDLRPSKRNGTTALESRQIALTQLLHRYARLHVSNDPANGAGAIALMRQAQRVGVPAVVDDDGHRAPRRERVDDVAPVVG